MLDKSLDRAGRQRHAHTDALLDAAVPNRTSIDSMAVKSPCIEQCRFDGRTGFCTGCLRTQAEAREWKKMTDHRRHQIVNERARRERKLAGK